MTDTHSEETMNKAREMLSDMAELADYQPFNLTHSDWVMKMWKAFNKGREYEQFATEAEAREKHPDIKTGKFPFLANGRALTLNEPKGLVKFVVDAEYGEILGVHIVSPEASELIAEAVFAMQAEACHEDIASCVHAHPTLSEAIMEAALAVEGRSVNF